MNRGARSILATMFLAFVLVGSYYVWTGPDTPPIGERATLEVAPPTNPTSAPAPKPIDASTESVPLAALEEMPPDPAPEATVDSQTHPAPSRRFGVIEVGPRTPADSTGADEEAFAESGEDDSDEPRRVRVEQGDTLSSIARRHLGDGSRWQELYRANRDLIGPDPNALKVGQLLVLPVAAPR